MYDRIMVPVDGSPTSERGLMEAVRLAADQRATLHLLHVVDDYPLMIGMASMASYQETLDAVRRNGEQVLARAKAAAAEAGLSVKTAMRELPHGRIADVVVEECLREGCDLVVMGTHGRRGFNRVMMGSDAELVARTSPVPVLLVRPRPDAG